MIHYVDPAGKERLYETVERTTRTETTGVDGVDVISIIIHLMISCSASVSSLKLPATESKIVCSFSV